MNQCTFTYSQILDCLHQYQINCTPIKEIEEEEKPYKLITTDSRKVVANTLFIAINGNAFDGHHYAEQAIEAGATTIICEKQLPVDCPQLIVADTRTVYGLLMKQCYPFPDEEVTLVGITGTNGKTTTSFIIQHICESNGFPCAIIGTTGIYFRDYYQELPNTTPDIEILYTQIQHLYKLGARTVVLEVSSHAIDQKRIQGLQFQLGIFTNLTQDHLDYHHSMEEYKECKFRLFSDYCTNGIKVFNLDDQTGMDYFDRFESKKIGYSLLRKTDLHVMNLRTKEDGSSDFLLQSNDQLTTVQFPLSGVFNVYNALAAASITKIHDISNKELTEALKTMKPVPGRMQAVPNNAGLQVFVDYAHTPDALKNILSNIRKQKSNHRLITIFGCGGDRDRAKRPKMREAVESHSDYFIITNDNPRTENPKTIVEDILQNRSMGFFHVQLNRKQAISEAIQMSEPGDFIVIAGKGHEEYQIIGTEKTHFSDFETACTLLREKENADN